VEGVLLQDDGKELRFTGVFRDSVLSKLGVKPELPQGKPPAVQHLGGLKLKVGDREVEFGNGPYAKLTFPSGEEAERFASSLKAAGVYAEVTGNVVRLDSDAFFGLLAATDATPPGLTPLYRSDDLQVYASVEESHMRFYFAVKYEGVWRAVEGLYAEKWIQLWRAEREVLEAIRDAVAKALKQLGGSADVEEPKEKVDERGDVKAYYLHLYGHHLKPFLEYAAENVETKPAEVRLEGRRVVVKAGDVETEIEFKLLKGKEAEFLMTKDMEQTLALYKSLKEMGVRVEVTPKGVKINSETLWSLIAAAIERSAPSGLPAKVMPGIELLKVYDVSGMKMYIFRAENAHYYFVVKMGDGWRAAGGKYDGRQVQIYGEATEAVAEAINALYREIGVERRVEVKYDKRNNKPYLKLTNEDLRQLNLKE